MDRIVLAYASQTGQSKAIAEDMSDMAKSRGINVEAQCLSSFGREFSLGSENYMLFVVSTTGDGDPPDVATKFWRSLKKSKENLENMSYSLLGLGDTNYTNFCNFGKMLDKRLKEMNAQAFFPSMWADDAVGLESVAKVWMEGTMNKMLEIFKKEKSLIDSSHDALIDATGSLSVENKLPTKSHCCVNQGSSVQDVLPISGDHFVSLNHTQEKLLMPEKGHNIVSEYFELNLEDFDNLQLPSCPARILEIVPGVLEHDEKGTTFPFYFKESNHFFLPSSQTDLGLAVVKDACNLTEGLELVKKILSMEFDILECSWNKDILPGDTVGIICPNDNTEVEELISRIGIQKSEWCCRAKFEVIDVLMAKKKKIAKLEKCRIHDLLTWHMDIRTIPKKAFLRSLVEVTKNQDEKKVLEILCSQQGSEHYNRIFLEQRLTILDLLKLLPSCNPSLGMLYEHLPKLLPRPYSICTSSHLDGGSTVSIVFSVSEYETASITVQNLPEVNHNISKTSPNKKRLSKMGICTGWLFKQYTKWRLAKDSRPSLKLAMYLRKPTQFRPPDDDSVPLILIGAGTGISPFIGFLQHRLDNLKANKNASFGETWLFFGCRGRNDFIFRKDLEEFKASGVLNHVQVCFSREADSINPRYVQDGIVLHGAILVPLILNTSVKIYICGDAAKLTAAVKSALKTIIESKSDLTTEEIVDFCNKLQSDKRIIEDVWI